MPKRPRKHLQWTPGRLKNRAKDIGAEVQVWIAEQLSAKAHPGYISGSMSIVERWWLQRLPRRIRVIRPRWNRYLTRYPAKPKRWRQKALTKGQGIALSDSRESRQGHHGGDSTTSHCGPQRSCRAGSLTTGRSCHLTCGKWTVGLVEENGLWPLFACGNRYGKAQGDLWSLAAST